MLPAPSQEVWTENVDLKWDSGALDDAQWHLVGQFSTPAGLACLDEIEANINWKGNPGACCKIVFLRGGTNHVKEIIPFGHPTGGANYCQAGCKAHVLYHNNSFMGHYRPGDKIGVLFKVGLGQWKLKVKEMHIFLKGRMAQTQQQMVNG